MEVEIEYPVIFAAALWLSGDVLAPFFFLPHFKLLCALV